MNKGLLHIALQTVMLSVKPIKYLCVYGTYDRCVEDFAICATHAQLVNMEFRINHSERKIITPRGSQLIFKALDRSFESIQGIELDDYWIDPSHPNYQLLVEFLMTRHRSK